MRAIFARHREALQVVVDADVRKPAALMGTEMASATDDDSNCRGEGATELMGNDVVGLDTFAERMLPCNPSDPAR